MDLSAAHAGYVFAAYGLSAVVLGIAIVLNMARARATARRLSDLEARHVPRRRAAGSGDAS